MRVYYLSDIHNDYHGENALLELVGDINAVLVVAGDINSKGRSVADLEAVADRWKAVIAVPGNHDWWGLAIHERHKFKSDVENVHMLLEDFVVVGDTTFCGTSLWHLVGNPIEEMSWQYTMHDAKKIRGRNYSRLRGLDVDIMHQNGVEFIKDCRRVINGKKVLITHHAMSKQSISARHQGLSSNKYYFTPLEHLLDGFSHHIHGHVHQEFDYIINNCNVLCNPRAYSSENPDFGIRIFDV